MTSNFAPLRFIRFSLLRFFLGGLIFLFAFSSGHLANASGPADGDRFNVFVAAGPAWNFPGSIRIGTRTIEGGLIAPATGGVVYNLWDDNISVSLGLGGAWLGGTVGYGPYMGLGWQWNLLWILKLRGEVFAFGSHNGWVVGGAQVGLNLTF